jgi:hypothetical protein
LTNQPTNQPTNLWFGPLCLHATASSASDLFLNLERIYAFHTELHRRLSSDLSIRGIINAFSNEMINEIERVYTVYLGHYDHALSLFYQLRDESDKFRKFITLMEKQALKVETIVGRIVLGVLVLALVDHVECCDAIGKIAEQPVGDTCATRVQVRAATGQRSAQLQEGKAAKKLTA